MLPSSDTLEEDADPQAPVMSAFHCYERRTAPEASTSGAGTSSATPIQRRQQGLIARLTCSLVHTYRVVNPTGFGYSLEANPRRALTKPADGCKNDGFDNDDNDLIMHVNDVLINSQPADGVDRTYVVQEMLGQGTFGQVACCWSSHFGKGVAVKVIKNQPAYYHQARVEIGLLQLLNTRCDPNDAHRIVRMLDYFLFRKHLCLVFEKLDVNLFELLKRNSFRGLSLTLVQLFLRQILEALTVLRDAAIIHCDLKPENILLKSSASGDLKLIDFGSACFEGRTVYSYIQSRFYRSPEVVLGCTYTVAIDMWSFGCVAAELFLGLPLFPGASEHDLMARIDETLGAPPEWLLRTAKHADKFYNKVTSMDRQGAAKLSFVRMGVAEFETRNGCKAPAGKRYFPHTSLPDIIGAYPVKQGLSDAEMVRERTMRESFIDFLIGVLDTDPLARWTPRQASSHPFITGDAFVGPHQPPPDVKRPSLLATQPPPPPPMSISSSSHHPSTSVPTTSGMATSYPSSFVLATPPRAGGRGGFAGGIPLQAQQQQQQPASSSYRSSYADDGMGSGGGNMPGTSGRPSDGMMDNGAASAAQHAHAHAMAMAAVQNLPQYNPQFGFLGSSVPNSSHMPAGVGGGGAGPSGAIPMQQQQQMDWRQDPRMLAAAAAAGTSAGAAAAAAAAIPLGSTLSTAQLIHHRMAGTPAAMAAAAAAAAAHGQSYGPHSPSMAGSSGRGMGMGGGVSGGGGGHTHYNSPAQHSYGGRSHMQDGYGGGPPPPPPPPPGSGARRRRGSDVDSDSVFAPGSLMQPPLNYLAASYRAPPQHMGGGGGSQMSYQPMGVDPYMLQQIQQHPGLGFAGGDGGSSYTPSGGGGGIAATAAYNAHQAFLLAQSYQDPNRYQPPPQQQQQDDPSSSNRGGLLTNNGVGGGGGGGVDPSLGFDPDLFDGDMAEALLFAGGSNPGGGGGGAMAGGTSRLQSPDGSPGDWDPLYSDDQLLDEGAARMLSVPARMMQHLADASMGAASGSGVAGGLVVGGGIQPFFGLDGAGGAAGQMMLGGGGGGLAQMYGLGGEVLVGLPGGEGAAAASGTNSSWSHAPRGPGSGVGATPPGLMPPPSVYSASGYWGVGGGATGLPVVLVLGPDGTGQQQQRQAASAPTGPAGGGTGAHWGFPLQGPDMPDSGMQE